MAPHLPLLLLLLPLLLLLLMCAFSLVAAAALPALDIPPAQLMQKFALRGNSLCNDGTPPMYFYRNCSANWDRKNGAPDYCLKGGSEGVTEYIWQLVFLSSDVYSVNNSTQSSEGLFCYDDHSCRERLRFFPNVTSSAHLPDTYFPGGFLSAYAEENPNFYKSISVLVPYCSSDMFLGDASDVGTGVHFHGRRIVNAVMKVCTNENKRASVCIYVFTVCAMAMPT